MKIAINSGFPILNLLLAIMRQVSSSPDIVWICVVFSLCENVAVANYTTEIKTLQSAFWFAVCFFTLCKEALFRVLNKNHLKKNTKQRSSLLSVKKKHLANTRPSVF